MAPTTRSSTKKSAHKDERDIISWTSAVTGETLIYEKFHTYEDEGEVLYVQLRVTEDGVLVPWTKDTEDGTTKINANDDDKSTDGLQKTKAPSSKTVTFQRKARPTPTSYQKQQMPSAARPSRSTTSNFFPPPPLPLFSFPPPPPLLPPTLSKK